MIDLRGYASRDAIADPHRPRPTFTRSADLICAVLRTARGVPGHRTRNSPPDTEQRFNRPKRASLRRRCERKARPCAENDHRFNGGNPSKPIRSSGQRPGSLWLAVAAGGDRDGDIFGGYPRCLDSRVQRIHNNMRHVNFRIFDRLCDRRMFGGQRIGQRPSEDMLMTTYTMAL